MDYEDEINPELQAGLPADPNLAVIKEYNQNEVFQYHEGYEGMDSHVVSGEIPPHMKNFFFGFFTKDNVLTNLNDKDIILAKLRFKRARMAYRMSRPKTEYTYDTLRQLDNLEQMFISKIKRSYKGFERTEQNKQVTQTLVGQARGPPEQERRSFGSRFFGLG